MSVIVYRPKNLFVHLKHCHFEYFLQTLRPQVSTCCATVTYKDLSFTISDLAIHIEKLLTQNNNPKLQQ